MKKVLMKIATLVTLAVMLFSTTACAKEIIYVTDLTGLYMSYTHFR